MTIANADLLAKLLQIEEKIDHVMVMQDPNGEYCPDFERPMPAPSLVTLLDEATEVVGVSSDGLLDELRRWKEDRLAVAAYMRNTNERIKELTRALEECHAMEMHNAGA
jgi:hypothetical protein